jgi:hypothetical protein
LGDFWWRALAWLRLLEPGGQHEDPFSTDASED